MAVILEAYLLGCGQAMLDSFARQVQAVEALQEVDVFIKSLYPERNDLTPAGATPLPLYLVYRERMNDVMNVPILWQPIAHLFFTFQIQCT